MRDVKMVGYLDGARLARELRDEAENTRDEYREALLNQAAYQIERLVERIDSIRAESLRKHNAYVVDQALRNATAD
jgi:hypothetical protein